MSSTWIARRYLTFGRRNIGGAAVGGDSERVSIRDWGFSMKIHRNTQREGGD